MNQIQSPLSWVLWHPHQGLWNWRLIGILHRIIPSISASKIIEKMIINFDTFILFIRAFFRRMSRLGIINTLKMGKMNIPNDISILYLDLGTHKEGSELSFMVEKILPSISKKYTAYGFEASQESFLCVNSRFFHKQMVSILNLALCHEVPSNGKIKLYKDLKEGVGDSIYRQSESYEEIVAKRLSDWLKENNINLGEIICLLRMNIEGSEFDVIKDLVERKLANYIDGYYGMWDDVSKIDKLKDKKFRDFLKENKIYPFTFNGRDMNFPLRLQCIEYDIHTSIAVAVNRKIKSSTL